jgi:alginate O-acetyltransferase complex protein AlgI
VAGTKIPLLHLTLPIGISFYTFQTISYIIDVYRSDASVQKNVISYGAYVTMFPQLIAGPIVQYRTIDAQLRSRKESMEEFAQGVNRFMIGLGKKVLLANQAGVLWDQIRVMDTGKMPVLTAWIGIAAYTFQIYFDFSGYSDMAIGLGHMFGFRFLENFDHPYLASSATEFWRRWHISLGTWFREYVYIPLGGNRVGRAGLIRNTLVVWLLTGIWHGADWNFMIWGVYYGILLLLEKLVYGKYLQRLPSFLRHFYAMFAVMIGWYIFSFNEISGGLGYLTAMFGSGGRLLSGGSIYLLYSNGILLAALILGSTNLPQRIASGILARVRESDAVSILLRSLFYAAVFLLSTASLVGASYNPFLYFRF